jgi:hypothetical protein
MDLKSNFLTVNSMPLRMVQMAQMVTLGLLVLMVIGTRMRIKQSGKLLGQQDLKVQLVLLDKTDNTMCLIQKQDASISTKMAKKLNQQISVGRAVA